MLRRFSLRTLLIGFTVFLASCGSDSGGGNGGGGGNPQPQNNAPTITLQGANPLTLTVGESFSDPGATSNDAEDGNLTSSISVDSSNLNITTVGSYIVIYSVTDSDGATTEVDRVVDVVASTASKAFISAANTSRFLSQTTFGPTADQINNLTGTDVSQWLITEFNKDATLHLPRIQAKYPDGRPPEEDSLENFFYIHESSHSFWQTAITADDQLRQRMAYALSQILVVANPVESFLGSLPLTMAHYMDILTNNAFGNYRDILQEVTYSPAMAIYLTYLFNEKADPETGRMPDENYARELMQLFTIGLVELNMDGTVKTSGGTSIETYDNDDITGLAKVLTGLVPADFDPEEEFDTETLFEPLKMINFIHSDTEKSFLGTTIPANTEGDESIELALDHIFAHPNLAPFIGRQLIQRFTVSNPSPAYVGRVAQAFETGSYELPNGTLAGTGNRGDLAATLAAILLDVEAREDTSTNSNTSGKIREPVLRFIQWARAFDINSADPQDEEWLYDAGRSDRLAQHPYRSRSVFNFYRPGYIAPGTATGDAGMSVPELQIMNASTVMGYVNFMSAYIRDDAQKWSDSYGTAFHPDYTPERALATNPEELVDHLDLLLAGNRLRADTKDRIVETLNEIPIPDGANDENIDVRVHNAILMVMTAPGYMTQR